MLEPELEGDAATAVNSSATKLHYYATPLAMPVKRRRRRRGRGRERERGWFCLLARIHIPPRAAAAAGRSRASSRSVLHPKNGLRRNTALEEGTSVACFFGPGMTHESPFPLSSNLSNPLSFPAWPVPSLTLCLAAESVVVAEKRNSIFSGRRYAEFC